MAHTTLTKFEYTDLTDLHDGVRAHYGGRGMYGKTCLAYVGDEPHLFLFDLAKVLVERDSAELPATADEIRDKLDRLGGGSSDSMGMGTVYYWRGIEVDIPEGEDGDDDE
jgi:hypothetical protein